MYVQEYERIHKVFTWLLMLRERSITAIMPIMAIKIPISLAIRKINGI
jgi:hypothetical protein